MKQKSVTGKKFLGSVGWCVWLQRDSEGQMKVVGPGGKLSRIHCPESTVYFSFQDQRLCCQTLALDSLVGSWETNMAQEFQTFNTTILLKNLPPKKQHNFSVGCLNYWMQQFFLPYPLCFFFSFGQSWCYTLPNEDSNGNGLCVQHVLPGWQLTGHPVAPSGPRWLPAASPLIASLMLAAPPKNHCGIWLFSCWWPYLRAQGVGQHLKIHPQNQQSLESMIVCSKCSGALIIYLLFLFGGRNFR